jgi:hypothetical protein
MTGLLVTAGVAIAAGGVGGVIGYRLGYRHGLTGRSESFEEAVSILKRGKR